MKKLKNARPKLRNPNYNLLRGGGADTRCFPVQAAMAGTTGIEALLDIEPVFHELMYEDEWRAQVTNYYEQITYEGIRQALRSFNAAVKA